MKYLYNLERESPLKDGRPLNDEERKFWCEVYLAFMQLSAAPSKGTGVRVGGETAMVPCWFADGAVVELRQRCAPKDEDEK